MPCLRWSNFAEPPLPISGATYGLIRKSMALTGGLSFGTHHTASASLINNHARGCVAVRGASLVGHRGVRVEVLRANGCVDRVSRQPLPITTGTGTGQPKGLFRRLKGYLFFLVFDAGFLTSRRVAESAALNG